MKTGGAVAAPGTGPPCRSRCGLGIAAVQEEHLRPNVSGQVACEQVAHLGELGEDQGPLAGRQHLLEHLRRAGASLPERPASGEPSPQELRRVVADLLQLGQRGAARARGAGCPSARSIGSSISSTTAW